jgi:peptidoglycan/LPS O-acetylase OafA/YrhL
MQVFTIEEAPIVVGNTSDGEHKISRKKASRKIMTAFKKIFKHVVDIFKDSQAPIHNRFEVFDGLRGSFAVLVVVYHMVEFIPLDGDYQIVAMTGTYIAVVGFFIMSSFLLTYKTLNDLFKIRVYENTMRQVVLIVVQYFVRRFFRIYIPFVVYVTLVKYVSDVFGGFLLLTDGFEKAKSGAFSSWSDLVQLNNTVGFNHLWTIPIEIKFYLLLPVICVATFASRSHLNIYILFLCGLNYLYFNHWRRMSVRDLDASDKFFACTPVFFNGSLIAILYFKFEQIINIKSSDLTEDYDKSSNATTTRILKVKQFILKFYYRIRFRLMVIFLYIQKVACIIFNNYLVNFCIGCGLSFLFFSGFWRFSEYFVSDLNFFYSLYDSSLQYGLLLFLLLIFKPNFFTRAFSENYLLKTAGKYSFGIYLFHPTAMLIKSVYYDKARDRKPQATTVELLIVTLFLAYLCGWTFFYVVENPMMKASIFINKLIKNIKF